VPTPEKTAEPLLQLVPGSGRKASLDDVYRHYCRYVAAIIVRLDGRAVEVDDLVQDVFVEAAAGIERLRDPEAIKGWLATIAVRMVRRRLRARRLWRFLGFARPVEPGDLVDSAASPLDRLLLRSVYRVLDEMPTEDRLAFCLHTVEGQTVEEVAEHCGCSYATAKRRVSRAQRRIEQRLADG
jgi:RNA polymerase sigma-70 factor, ECF subfamily